MPRCFVIQPFSPKFDKRYDEDYKPALEAAGLEAYRVDQDPRTERLIDSIEEEIHKATICLADITTDNPNVWYELGYAFAVGRSVIMVCSNERDGKYPFDIQHRTVINYASDSRSDFDKLRDEISTRAKALVKKNEARQVIEAQPVAPTSSLKEAEILVLGLAAGETAVPGQWVNAWSLRECAKNAGLSRIVISVAIRGLQQKGFVEFNRVQDEGSGEMYDGVTVTDAAWTWLYRNDSLFTGRKKEDAVPLTKDDIPF